MTAELLDWAAEQAARAPRISAGDAQPLIAIFREVLAEKAAPIAEAA